MKRIVLCADDYGQALHISAGILDLVRQGRLSAVSCMVNTPFWPLHAKWLNPFKEQVDIGLHFNLTEGKPLSAAFQGVSGGVFPSLPKWLKKTFLGQVDYEVVVAECHAQIDKFVAELGFLPRFIDGHQHVHQLPIIRNALIKVYQDRLLGAGSYVRIINVKRGLALKPWIIYLTGTAALCTLLRKNKIPYNPSFAGIYEFSASGRYPQLFPQFLEQSANGGIIMCHPGHLGKTNEDSIAIARFAEYRYLSSDLFLAACAHHQVVIERFSEASFD